MAEALDQNKEIKKDSKKSFTVDMTKSSSKDYTKKLTLSIMRINQGEKAKEVLNKLYTMFGVTNETSITDPIGTGKAILNFTKNTEEFMKSLGELATQRVDDPTSIHDKVGWFYLPLPTLSHVLSSINFLKNLPRNGRCFHLI